MKPLTFNRMISFPWVLVGAAVSMTVTSLQSQDLKPFTFKQLSLQMPESWVTQAEAKVVPAVPLYNAEAAAELKKDPLSMLKPDYSNMPEHVSLSLAGAPLYAGKEFAFVPEIMILPVAEFTRICDPEQKASPEMVAAFAEIASLAEKKTEPEAGQPLPFVPYLDASQSVTVAFRTLNSGGGGKGFRFVTQYDIEPSLLSEDRLTYIYQGLSADWKTYVVVTIPILLGGMPKADAKEHLGFSTENYEEFMKKVGDYRKKASAWLVENEEKMKPSLKMLDTMMCSIVLK